MSFKSADLGWRRELKREKEVVAGGRRREIAGDRNTRRLHTGPLRCDHLASIWRRQAKNLSLLVALCKPGQAWTSRPNACQVRERLLVRGDQFHSTQQIQTVSNLCLYPFHLCKASRDTSCRRILFRPSAPSNLVRDLQQDHLGSVTGVRFEKMRMIGACGGGHITFALCQAQSGLGRFSPHLRRNYTWPLYTFSLP